MQLPKSSRTMARSIVGPWHTPAVCFLPSRICVPESILRGHAGRGDQMSFAVFDQPIRQEFGGAFHNWVGGLKKLRSPVKR